MYCHDASPVKTNNHNRLLKYFIITARYVYRDEYLAVTRHTLLVSHSESNVKHIMIIWAVWIHVLDSYLKF